MPLVLLLHGNTGIRTKRKAMTQLEENLLRDTSFSISHFRFHMWLLSSLTGYQRRFRWSERDENLIGPGQMFEVRDEGRTLAKIDRYGYISGITSEETIREHVVLPIRVNQYKPTAGTPSTYGPDKDSHDVFAQVCDWDLHIGLAPKPTGHVWLNYMSLLYITHRQMKEGGVVVLYYRYDAKGGRDIAWFADRDTGLVLAGPSLVRGRRDHKLLYVTACIRAVGASVTLFRRSLLTWRQAACVCMRRGRWWRRIRCSGVSTFVLTREHAGMCCAFIPRLRFGLCWRSEVLYRHLTDEIIQEQREGRPGGFLDRRVTD